MINGFLEDNPLFFQKTLPIQICRKTMNRVAIIFCKFQASSRELLECKCSDTVSQVTQKKLEKVINGLYYQKKLVTVSGISAPALGILKWWRYLMAFLKTIQKAEVGAKL